MNRLDDRPKITSERLTLLPLQVGDAEQMAEVLADERLHEFIGGQPATDARRAQTHRRAPRWRAGLGELAAPAVGRP